MPLSSWGRRLLFACALAAAWLVATPSFAASVRVTGAPVRSFNPPANVQGYQNTWINYSDCEQDLQLAIPLAFDSDLLSNGAYQVEVWAGANCDELASRVNTTGLTCWQVAAGTVGKSQNPTATISARGIVSQYVATPKVPYPYGTGPIPKSVCEGFASGQATINVWFIIVDGAKNPIGNAQLGFTADLVGPPPPSGLVAGIGDTALIVSWTPSADTSSQTQGFIVYCDPPPPGNTVGAPSSATDAGSSLVCQDGGFDGAVDGGAIVEGGFVDGGCAYVANDAGTSSGTPSACRSTVLVSGGGTITIDEAGISTTVGGVQRFIDPGYICGQPNGATTKEYPVRNLVNGTYYTVAVAGIDAFGNTGPLSDPRCNTPMEIVDFWNEYTKAGGQAGGGFCSLGTGPGPASTSLLALGVWGLVSVVRRRKKS